MNHLQKFTILLIIVSAFVIIFTLTAKAEHSETINPEKLECKAEVPKLIKVFPLSLQKDECIAKEAEEIETLQSTYELGSEDIQANTEEPLYCVC